MPNFSSNFLDSPLINANGYVWIRNIDRTVTIVAMNSVMPLQFPIENPGFELDFSVNYSQFLEGYDSIISGSTQIGLSGAQIIFSCLQNPYLTCWVNGGLSGNIYPINYTIHTKEGRVLSTTIWLPCDNISEEPPYQ